MKNTIRVAIALMAICAVAFGVAEGKEDPPKPEKMKKLSFPDFKEFKTKNGMELIVVEHNEQPVVTIYTIVRTGSAADPAGKESLANFTIDQLNKGTKTRSALELAEWIESVGGSVGSFSDQDWSVFTVSVLSEYLDVAYEYLRDVFMNPVFPDDELELLRKQAKTGLEFELSDPGAMARRHMRTLVYGDHPYSKQPTVKSVESITRDDVVNFYKKNFVANNILMSVVGDVKGKKVKKAVEKYFGDLPTGTPAVVDYAGTPKPGDSKISLYHRPGAVQTEVLVGHLAPDAKNADWPRIAVANRILGGGADARLFMNLREEKGWTYGAYSRFSREKDMGMFTANAAVRTEVTDSALVELMSELDRIRDERVSEDDLKNAHAYLIGNFPIQIETPDQIARRVGQYKLLGLGKKELETYRERLAQVTIDDVHRVMNEYLHPDRARLVLVGDATQIKDKVAVVAPVELFDIAGEPLSLDAMAITAVDYEYDTSEIRNMSATYALTVQEMNIGDLDVKLEKTGEVIAVSANLTGMISMEQSMEFSASDLSPIAYKSTMKMGPQSMGSEFSFTADAGTGRVQSPEFPEPKEVAFTLVDGTIIDGALEYAMGCLPLEVNKSYRFPVVDSQKGVLQNINVEVLELVDVETAAGTFKTFKVKVKRPEGDAYMYIGKDSPHVLVKQEVPAQAMSMELKSIAN